MIVIGHVRDNQGPITIILIMIRYIDTRIDYDRLNTTLYSYWFITGAGVIVAILNVATREFAKLILGTKLT